MSNPAPPPVPDKAFPFLRLPLELRESIYSQYFKPADRLHDIPIENPEYESPDFGGGCYRFDFRLYRVCKQIYSEAQTVWRRENIFVRIDTPWPTAVNHISSEGLVPIVVNGSKGDKFHAHHALVQIHAPFHQATPQYSIVVLLDDLYLFCQVWLYSALSYPMLNERLSTNFVLRDPYYPADPKPVPISLQKRLLLPFEKVKGLYRVEVEGYDESVKKELERRMAIPNPTVQQCCEQCATLMEQGDAQLSSGGDPHEALKLYNDAFHAIHVLINGRTRRVLADGFFHDGIEHGRYAGHSGMTVRVILRIKLVARVISAYLKLSEWGEAAFWGMRSIRIMREAIDTDFDEFLEEFVGSEDIGAIYARTGVAFWKMEHRRRDWAAELEPYEKEQIANSGALFQLAAKYLRRRKMRLLEKELGAYDVSIPDEILRESERRKSESDMASMTHLHLDSADSSAGSSNDD